MKLINFAYDGTGVEIKPNQFYFNIESGSVILDPWRTIHQVTDCKVIHYGKTRSWCSQQSIIIQQE